jgi:aryl-alcohol dehydrogenase-like predicted oxidoreductase
MVSVVSLGTWQFGGSWGAVDETQAMRALNRALDLGVNFFDTADVYGDGRSEKLLGKLRHSRKEPFYVATKVGLRLNPNIPRGYNRENITSFVDRSLRNLATEAIDVLQLHSPPTDVYYDPDVFDVLDKLVKAGKIKYCGVSVNRVEEGLKAIEYPIVRSVQIVYNMLRQRPEEIFFAEAKRRGVAVIARLPLSSGLLSGKMHIHTEFPSDDHRNYNRSGEHFDRGETFSGIDYNLGLRTVRELESLVAPNATMAQWALRWVLMNDAVSCVIPGAKRPEQVEENAAAAVLDDISPEVMAKVKKIYDDRMKDHVHNYW